MSIGLVLGSGGAKGAFELGALEYLVGPFGLSPDLIAGTSVGALFAAKLAESANTDELRGSVAEIRDFVLSLQSSAELFTAQPWVADLEGTPLGAKLHRLLGFRASAEDATPGPARRHPGSLPWRGLLAALMQLPAVVHDIPQHASSLLTAAPLAARLRGNDGSQPLLDPIRLAQSGRVLRLGVVDLDAGQIRWVTESGALLDDELRQLTGPGIPVDLVDAVLASCAVPAVLEPVLLGGALHVDGTIARGIPLDVAIRSGARDVYVVANNPPSLQPKGWTSPGSPDLLTIMHRAYMEIAIHELHQANRLSPPDSSARVTTIEPTVGLLDPLEFSQELVAIDMDYGYLRAADATCDLESGSARRAAALSDLIVQIRLRAWHEEETVGAGSEPLTRVQALKWLVGQALESRERLGVEVPTDARRWVLGWEHPSPPTRFPAAGPWAGTSTTPQLPRAVHWRENRPEEPGEQSGISAASVVVDVPPGTCDLLGLQPER